MVTRPPSGETARMPASGGDPGGRAAPGVWRASAIVRGEPCEILRALTDPELIATWAPMSFELEHPGARRLRAGSQERVSGSLAGLRASFDVEVTRADDARLELVAEGPLAMDVAYSFRAQGRRVRVDASIGLRRRGGLAGTVARAAVAALLDAGALERALQRLAQSLREPAELELMSA
jgi:hypothetical protein